VPVKSKKSIVLASTAALLASALASPASADLVVSQLIVEMDADRKTTDVEIFNDSEERSYIVIEPKEVLRAGTPAEDRVSKSDPKELGLLVSANRMILEPGQRKLLRLAMVGAPGDKERVYRVAVKPVVGDVSGSATGLKVLVGYDMLVLARPATVGEPAIVAERLGRKLTLTNKGNSSVELGDGQYCRTLGNCTPLAGKRLYAGMSWTQEVGEGGHVRFKARSGAKWKDLSF
jgi:P pilus assembly chaperone PapD